MKSKWNKREICMKLWARASGFIKTTIFYCSNIDPKSCKLVSQVDGCPFYALGAKLEV